MGRRNVLLIAMVLVAACQSAGTATSTPTEVAAATTAPTAAATATPTKPATLPRVADLPLDGSCESDEVSCLGKLEAGKVYASKIWEPTISFSMPTSDWVNPADTGGDFDLLSTRDIGDGIRFFRGARSKDPAVGATVSEIAAWLAAYDEVTVTPATPVEIGGLTGVSMDIRISPGATNLDPGCPVQVCVPLLRGDNPIKTGPYPWHWDWASAGTEVQRLYLLNGPETVIAIFLDSADGLTFDALTQTFDAIAPTLAFG